MKKLAILLALAAMVALTAYSGLKAKPVVDKEVVADSLAWVACYHQFPELIRTAEDVERDSLEALASEIVEVADSAEFDYYEAQEDSLSQMIDEFIEIDSSITVWENGYGKVEKITYSDDRGNEQTWLSGQSVSGLPQSLLLDYRVTAQGNLLSRRKPFTDVDNISYSSKTPMMLYIATHRMWFIISGDD